MTKPRAQVEIPPASPVATMSYHDDAPDTIENCQKGPRTRSRRVVYSFNITHAGNQTAIEASPANTHEEYTWPESYPPSREITPVPPPRLQKIRKRMVVKPTSRVLRSHARLAKSAAALAFD
jgi:hypothetical protein